MSKNVWLFKTHDAVVCERCRTELDGSYFSYSGFAVHAQRCWNCKHETVYQLDSMENAQ